MQGVSKHIVQDYRTHVETIASLISKGPYKLEFICDQLGISRVTLNKKKKSASFTLQEIEKLTDLFAKV